ncbi:YitT family protein [Dendrosporobacter sp. 1207_IL3150]|uniref:YitT family protein n=1 Tax=Dendrosporobacter sp. 1207_IL3150 TaxID=3084054 RepID=UPI002FD97FCB
MNKWLRQYAGMTVGIVLTAAALNMFLIPNKIAAGGVSGLATVLHYLSGWSVGLIMLAFNIPLFFVGIKILGTRYGLNTLYGAAALSISIDLLAPYTPVLTHDLLLSSLYGGVLSGIGMGLVFRFKGNTAGTAMAAAILNKLYGISVGQALLAADFLVVAFAGVVFKSPELALYATISIFVTAQIIDLVQEGPSTSKAFLIMTDKPQQVADGILYEIDRGVTFLQGKGGYTGQDRELLLCVVSTSEVTQLKELIYQKDQKAFVIVADAHEVLGEGFTPVKSSQR